jgi:hypothetical protein
MSRKKHEEFESLALPRKEVPHLMGTHYRVYSDHENFKVVAATSAQEAMENSGIKNPLKVERETMLLYSLINLGGNPSVGAASEPLPSNSPAPAATTETTTEAISENAEVAAAALSNNDVDKLLQA